MGKKRSNPPATKVVDDEVVLGRPRRGAKLREEVWQDSKGVVVKYNLAYINQIVCRVDNGRVLGYDNLHGYHHRHFMGTVKRVDFKGYEKLSSKFRKEVEDLWRKENEAGS